MDQMNRWIKEWYDNNEDRVQKLMHDIWSHPEVALNEYYACGAVKEFVAGEGFAQIETHAAEDFNNPQAKPNCLIAVYGGGRPVIGIVGELDGLPGLGQAQTPEQNKIPGPGHGCGHNLMAGGAVSAACALRYAMEKEGIPGTIKLIEAPAEEIGVGKAFLAKNGVFSDLDLALMWHPKCGDLDFSPVPQQVAFRVQFEFHGKTTHAAGDVWNGRSALDALQLMNIGCEFLREHKRPDTWMHYCITNGGAAPNIVPDYASALYMFRALDDYASAEDLFNRAVKCAEGAAIMTETTMNYKVQSVMPQFWYNLPLCRFLQQEAKKVPPLTYTEEEYKLAREHYRSLFGEEPPKDSELIPSGVRPFTEDKSHGEAGCTDAADMTYFCPAAHIYGLGYIKNAPGHSWSVTFTAGTSLGEKAGVYAYKILAQAAWDAMNHPEIIEELQKAHREMKIPKHKDWV